MFPHGQVNSAIEDDQSGQGQKPSEDQVHILLVHLVGKSRKERMSIRLVGRRQGVGHNFYKYLSVDGVIGKGNVESPLGGYFQ